MDRPCLAGGEPLTIIAHNAQFDVSFLDAAERVYDPTSPVFDCKWACTKEMSWELNPQKRHHRVADLIVDYHIGDVENPAHCPTRSRSRCSTKRFVLRPPGEGSGMKGKTDIIQRKKEGLK